jgi:hypothetical protein
VAESWIGWLTPTHAVDRSSPVRDRPGPIRPTGRRRGKKCAFSSPLWEKSVNAASLALSLTNSAAFSF